MSSKIGRDKRRDSTASPPPALAIGKSHSSSSFIDPKTRRVDMILSRDVAIQQNSPQKCFNLAGNYRNNPRYHPQTILKNMRGAHSLPSSPRGACVGGGFSFPGVALSRSQSMPGGGPLGGLSVQQPPRAASAPPTPVAPPENAPDPRCERCIRGDPELEKNSDNSAWVCVACGTEAGMDYVSQARSGFCPSSEDNTRVADDPPTRTAQEDEYLSWSKGPESEEDKRRRERAHVGGTRMSTQKLKQQNLIDAQNAIDKEAKRDVAEMLQEGGGPDQGRRKKIVRALEAVFDQLPLLIDAVRDHIRREAIRIYSNSMKHEAACGGENCMFALSQRTNAVIAYGITEYTLGVLADPSLAEGDIPVTRIASLQPDWGEKDVQMQLRALNEVQVKNSNPAMRMTVHSAIAIIARWTPQQARSGAPCRTNQPPSVRAPPAFVNGAPFHGRPMASADSGGAALKLRDRLVATAQSPQVAASDKVLTTALAQLGLPPAAAFLQESEHSCDVVAISLLAASALKLNEDDPTIALRKHYLPNHNVSETTVREFVRELQGLINTTNYEDIFK